MKLFQRSEDLAGGNTCGQNLSVAELEQYYEAHNPLYNPEI